MRSRAAAFVRLEHVSKHFGPRQSDSVAAVDAVTLDIHEGEIFCLLGASGCGKTTLLRMLAGFERPTSGRIFIDGTDMTDAPPYERPVNMMFQSYALFPHMTVERNVAFGLEQEKLPKSQIEARVAEMLGVVRLNGLERRKPHQLSGGQKQRVALARALVKRPKLLLLDEPLAALDRKLREHTQFELLNIQQRLGVTFVVVTHDQEEAMTLASRIGVMNHGRIVQVGAPAQVYEFPNSRFIADFIGSTNLLEGEVIGTADGHLRIESKEWGGIVSAGQGSDAAPGARVWLSLRPERIAIGREPPAVLENGVHGVVEEIAYKGDTSVCLVRLESGKQIRVNRPNLLRHPDGPIAREDRVWLDWHPAHAVVLTQ